MRQRIIIWIGLLLAAVTAAAQNRIDRFVDNESTIGRSKFTSVVERDPETREVVRVVKVRELSKGIDINACQNVFEAEMKTGRYLHTIDADQHHTLHLVVESERQDRIYMFQYSGKSPMQATDGKVTIVIRMKGKSEK